LNGYSRSTTPGLPAERIKMLREAHWPMFTDPECQEDIFLKRLECASAGSICDPLQNFEP
jgi:hypothetical protein